MKIGVITVYDSANYGSFLQAYALKLALEDMGNTVEFIKTRTESDLKKLFLGKKVLSKQYILNYKENRKKFKIFSKDRSRFVQRSMDEVTEETYDLVIIGSDELWNVNTPYFRNAFFYGKGIPTKRKLAYAISAGNATEEVYQEYTELKDAMKEIDTILVRDENTKNLVKQFTHRECSRVCDPTFLVDVGRLSKAYDNPIKERYLLVYAYRLGEKEKELVEKYAKKNNLKTVSSCMINEWCDYNITCSPLEFSKLIQDAEAVVTATFHGSIFSFLNKSRFVSFAKLSKVKDVLQLVGLEDAIVNENTSYKEFEEKLNSRYDYESVSNKILKYRQESLEMLSEVMGSTDFGKKDI